jgi:hypothetical protein
MIRRKGLLSSEQTLTTTEVESDGRNQIVSVAGKHVRLQSSTCVRSYALQRRRYIFALICCCGATAWGVHRYWIAATASRGKEIEAEDGMFHKWDKVVLPLTDRVAALRRNTADELDDTDCIFRDSPIRRKVFVYPDYGDTANGWTADVLSSAGQKWQTTLPPWPWLDLRRQSQANRTSHYDIEGQHVQYATELLVREVMINPKSCLRTYNPDEATLFYVPYLPSVEHHKGSKYINDMALSPYGNAILDILDKDNYTAWENTFGLTAKYWKRHGGADHILVFSEPMHGLWHPRQRRGNYHFIHSQKQLHPPIVISVELSTTFVKMYPKCAAKNILMPYPNTDGRWFNGKHHSEAVKASTAWNASLKVSIAALPEEQLLGQEPARPIAQFYGAGNHGTCKQLRQAMASDYSQCALSSKLFKQNVKISSYVIGMNLASFCPCPGGDSPSAKRMFDAVLAGCIPIILSQDFVWPFTNEFDPNLELDPTVFSLRYSAKDYEDPLLDVTTCSPLNSSKPGLQSNLEQISAREIGRLRNGLRQARDLYSWYQVRPDLPDNPLWENILPDGGTAHFLVASLAERAAGVRWPECEQELKLPRGNDIWKFKC